MVSRHPRKPAERLICGATEREQGTGGVKRSGADVNFAVIKTGGKQYKVAANDVLKIEKLEAQAGDIVTFDQVLMVGGDAGVTLGAPLVEGALVAAELVETRKQKTVIVFKKNRRHNYRRRNGHRQLLSTVRITEILTGGAQPTVGASRALNGTEDQSDARPNDFDRSNDAQGAVEGAGNTAPEAVGTEADTTANETSKTE